MNELRNHNVLLVARLRKALVRCNTSKCCDRTCPKWKLQPSKPKPSRLDVAYPALPATVGLQNPFQRTLEVVDCPSVVLPNLMEKLRKHANEGNSTAAKKPL